MDLLEWDDTIKEVSLELMDSMITEYKTLREEYELKKKEASNAHAEMEIAQEKVVSALQAANKKSYKVDGLGVFSLVNKQVITTPKTNEQKEMLFGYIKDTYGEEVLTSMVSINHQTLNSFYNQMAETSEDPSLFHLPGIDAPTLRVEARFTKAKK